MAADVFDELVHMFQLNGLSEAAARQAAIGRSRNEQEAREYFAGPRESAEASPAGGASLPPIDHARIRLQSCAVAGLGMSVTEASAYARRHQERALRRGTEQQASAYLLAFSEALMVDPPALVTKKAAVR